MPRGRARQDSTVHYNTRRIIIGCRRLEGGGGGVVEVQRVTRQNQTEKMIWTRMNTAVVCARKMMHACGGATSEQQLRALAVIEPRAQAAAAWAMPAGQLGDAWGCSAASRERSPACTRGYAAKAAGSKQAQQQGARKRKKAGLGDAEGARFSKTLEMCLRLLKGDATASAPDLTKEELVEGERLAKEYSRQWVRLCVHASCVLHLHRSLLSVSFVVLILRHTACFRAHAYHDTPAPEAARAQAESEREGSPP